MSLPRSKSYWVFSNKDEGSYNYNDWDMATILKTKRYYLCEKEWNLRHVNPGDVGYMRIYGDRFIGKFEVASEWKPDLNLKKTSKGKPGFFPIKNIEKWKRSLPQNLIIADLSNQNKRHRLIKITKDDSLKIEFAQRVYERLGLGRPDGEIIILEKGLEEAIKPNLKKLGLKLANENIQQQFSMGPGVGISDLICVDDHGDFVVIELKRGKSSDEVVGQLCRYIGYIKENIAKKGQKVQGWIVTGSYDEGLRLAAKATGIKLLMVRLP
jgi:hypothetical protein